MSERQKSKHTIVLYSKPGCHLCEDAKALLPALEKEFEIALEEVNILDDPALFELYKYTIPVMIVDKHIKLEARIDMKKLRRALTEGFGPKV